MKNYKATTITYWTATAFIFLFEGVMPALTSNSQLAVEGIRHLGYPDYFRVMLTVFKVVGALALILPFINKRIKEWAYAGFSFTAISAFVSHTAVDGFGVQAAFPLFVLAILAVSYLSYHRIAKYRQLRNSGESEYNVDGVLS
ncbi:MAG TPA: DoxX family protein [Flavipsychrobacter sp.]|nr:DoxX family protein [Flavipsychrobacter sp.]